MAIRQPCYNLYMRSLIAILIAALLIAPLTSFAATPQKIERLFYYMDTDSGYESLKKNATKIDILSPQAFTFDETGTLAADMPARVMEVLEKHTRIKLMPLIENEYFDLNVAHTVLITPVAQDKLIADMIKIGVQNKYWGYQLDMEHMNVEDRDLYSAFSEKMATALHAAGLKYSVAVSPRHSDNQADYDAGSWQKWTGVFDYAALAKSADFVSVMVYDQARSVGPTSTLTWYGDVVNYSLKKIPKEKLSIGIPFYGWEWIPGGGKKIASHTYRYVTDQVKNKMVESTFFNDVLGTGIMTYFVKVNGVKEKRVLWYENVRSFTLKYDIIKKYGLRGFSAWALGQEDARIWNTLPKR